MSRFTVVRPVPLYDSRGRQVRLAKPGTKGLLLSRYNRMGGSIAIDYRGVVIFDDDPGRSWDVDTAGLRFEGE